MPRAIIIVVDGLGVGELPDADKYADTGSNTLHNLSYKIGGLNIPCLESLGLGNIGDFKAVNNNPHAIASYGKMLELSEGKDSITGHWEMMGIVNEVAFPTYPNGFPREIISEFEKRIGRKVLGNIVASGTEIVERLGNEHLKTGSPIVYTSADSVFQIAAHEDVIPLDELYRICLIARDLLVEPHNVCRVIARPFLGPPFERTPRRRDYPVEPPEETLLEHLKKAGLEVIAVGKVIDLFVGRGFTRSVKILDTKDALRKIEAIAGEFEHGVLFSTLTDFDTVYGHRNDTVGYAKALEEFDKWLSEFIPTLKEDDYLFITADHGNDPTTPSTDHSREHVPLLIYNRKTPAHDLGTRMGFYDLGATVAEIFDIKEFKKGKSCLRA